MLNASGLLYLSARAVAAAGNLLAVAIFSRLAGPAEYGHYVLIFAWSLIVYGFGAQWMRFAYFGVYHLDRFNEYVGSLVRLLGVGIAVVAVVLAVLGIAGWLTPGFAFAIFAMVCGMTVYEAAFEVARTLLSARNAALSMVLRALLTIAFGSANLMLGGGARGLAIGIAVAQMIAALPSLATFSDLRWLDGSRTAALHIVRYGWPLLLSFGVTAIGVGVDRLLLNHYLGAAALGPYGMVADFMRQSFSVLGDAIVLSLVTVAKQQTNMGNVPAAHETLQKAFNACLAAATFGAAFFMVFGNAVLGLVLKPDFIAPTQDLIPIFAVAFAFTTLRNFYFAQVIYFTQASYLELMVSLLFLVASAALSLLLVPAYGTHGAAFAVMAASFLSCLAFVLLSRRWYKLPIDFVALGVMPSLAALCILGAKVAANVLPGGPTASLAVDALVFVALGGFAVHHFGLLTLSPVAIGSGGTR
jgi:O-antigen/teichoic acid export membrane protein